MGRCSISNISLDYFSQHKINFAQVSDHSHSTSKQQAQKQHQQNLAALRAFHPIDSSDIAFDIK